MNIENILIEGTNTLKQSGVSNPQLDCEILLSNSINKDKKYIILNPKQILNDGQLSDFKNLIEKRKKGEPIAYLINKKEFWNNEFFVNKDVLIPRPDTELIIEQVLKIYKNKNKINFLDIGFGSGCILLSILKERKNFKGTGVDISNHALKVCNTNAFKLGVKNRVKLYNSDIDKFVLGKYDLIISNPPYIKNLDLKYLDKDVIKFEPKLALDGGLDGISEIRKVIKKSSELIKYGGKLILEIAYNQTREVKKLLKKNGFYTNSVVKDLARNDRCIISTKIEE